MAPPLVLVPPNGVRGGAVVDCQAGPLRRSAPALALRRRFPRTSQRPGCRFRYRRRRCAQGSARQARAARGMRCGVAATLQPRRFLRIRARKLNAPGPVPTRRFGPSRRPISEPGLSSIRMAFSGAASALAASPRVASSPNDAAPRSGRARAARRDGTRASCRTARTPAPRARRRSITPQRRKRR